MSDSNLCDSDFRHRLAEHFHDLAQYSRKDIFGEYDSKYVPENHASCHEDNQTMFPGYVGEKYVPGKGILLLGINPGGGTVSYRRTNQDETFYTAWREFREAGDNYVLSCFDEANKIFIPIAQSWNLWRIINPTLEATSLRADEIAYMNIIPYRTRGDNKPYVGVCDKSWNRIIEPTLKVLSPKVIVSLGRKSGGIVDRHRLKLPMPVYCVPRTVGDSYVSLQARDILMKLREYFC